MTENEGWRKKFRPDIPSTARIYDYLLGGKDNYPADRAAAEQIAQVLPNVRTACQWNRAFLGRAVRFLAAERGIRQFIDIGTGLPTVRNVHEVAQDAAPGSHVVYVDNDPVVLAHGRHLLHGLAGTTILEHDLRQPDEILADPGLRALIDFEEPVAVLLVAVLHFIPDEDDPGGHHQEAARAVPGRQLPGRVARHRRRGAGGQRGGRGLRPGHDVRARPQPGSHPAAGRGPGPGASPGSSGCPNGGPIPAARRRPTRRRRISTPWWPASPDQGGARDLGPDAQAGDWIPSAEQAGRPEQYRAR